MQNRAVYCRSENVKGIFCNAIFLCLLVADKYVQFATQFIQALIFEKVPW